MSKQARLGERALANVSLALIVASLVFQLVTEIRWALLAALVAFLVQTRRIQRLRSGSVGNTT